VRADVWRRASFWRVVRCRSRREVEHRHYRVSFERSNTWRLAAAMQPDVIDVDGGVADLRDREDASRCGRGEQADEAADEASVLAALGA
jgi:hypothetical protein